MNFNKHSDLVGKHAFMSASQYHWTNYTEDKIVEVYRNKKAVERGERLHKLACGLISEKIRQVNNKKTFNNYVNTSIGLKMVPEQVLYYSPLCFGTADSISFDGKVMRIHDLKTGKTPASFRQLEVYAALACLEYNLSPYDFPIEMRIFQNDQVMEQIAEPAYIASLMDKIITFDAILQELEEE